MLEKQVVLFYDEPGILPPVAVLLLFSAGTSRRMTLVPILAQLERNYGKEKAETGQDNICDIFKKQRNLY